MPSVRFRLNGAETEVDADPDRPLLDILRGKLGVTGPHFGCGAGECGACHVIVGDRAITSCDARSEEHTSELQSQFHLVCRLLLEKKKKTIKLPKSTHN